MTAVQQMSSDRSNCTTSFKSSVDQVDLIGEFDKNNQLRSHKSNNPHRPIDTERYNFSRRTSLHNSTTSHQASNSFNGPNFGGPHSNSQQVFHAKRNSILQEELFQFENAIWETLPDNVEETDECEYEEHTLDSSIPQHTNDHGLKDCSTYKVGRTQFYTCHRIAMPGKDHGSHLNAEKQKGPRRGSLNLTAGINGSVLTKWVKSGFFPSDKEDDDKYFLVKSGTLEQLVEQCLNPHKKLDDPFFRDILLEQYCMFTDKITLSDQILQSTKTLLASPVIQRNSWKKTTPGHDNEDSIKENVKILIQKWKDDFPSDFQDQEALKVVETLTVTSALINSLHLKNSLERQKRLLEVKVKCFIEQTNPEMSILTSKGSPASTRKQTSMSRKDSNKHLLPSKFVLPFASTRGSEPTMIGLKVQTNVEAERNPDPRQVKSLVNRPKRRPLLRSLSNSESARGAFNQDHRMRCDSAIKTPDSPRRTFCPYSPAEVARQLTFKYSNYLLEMRPFEIVQYAQNYLDEDSSLQKIIELNKVLEAKIPSTILADLLLKSQKIGSIIEFWLKVAEELLELRNYECLQIVVHSLNSPMYDSSRLPEVWSHVDKLHLYNFEKLKETVSIEDNYQILRELQRKEESEFESNDKSKQSSQRSLKKTIARTLSRRRESKEALEKPGFIPCINVIKKDVLGILAAHKIDRSSNGVIAFAMHRKIHQQLQQIRLAQRLLKRSLQLQHNEQVWAWFERIPVVSKSQRDMNSTVLSKR